MRVSRTAPAAIAANRTPPITNGGAPGPAGFGGTELGREPEGAPLTEALRDPEADRELAGPGIAGTSDGSREGTGGGSGPLACAGATEPPIATCQEDAMTRLEGITVVMGLCALLATSSAWAESSPFVGRWQWNRAHSTPPPGAPVPKDLICDLARAEAQAQVVRRVYESPVV